MSKTKQGGTAKNVHDSPGKRLGVKLFGDQLATAGNIIVRQRGTRMEAGAGTRLGKDQTIFAVKSGRVTFTLKQITKFTGQKVRRTFVSVEDAK
jgi:large subunit ribosomal protein L27